MVKKKKVIGLTENITIIGKDKKKRVKARIDTGATKSSMDLKIAGLLRLGPVLKSKIVKSAHGKTVRPVIEATVNLKGETIKSEFTLIDRSHMRYKALIGQNTIKKGFLIDPSKK